MAASDAPSTAVREQVLALLRRHGWNATSFQTLEVGFRYFFDPPDGEPDACVACVDTGQAWVVAGAPIAAPERLAGVIERFSVAARAARRRVSIFAAEQRLIDAAGLAAMQIGEQPVWDPARWQDTVRQSRSLKEQLRRARAKGVSVRRVAPSELEPGASLRTAIEALIARWQSDKPMAPMGFLVDVQPFDFAGERRTFIAERAGELVGFLGAVPVYARAGFLLEDFLRDPAAPNGTAELLVDAAMRALAEEGSRWVTMGLAPLSGPVAGWLRAARRLSSALYDFRGLRAFKAKLRPHAWEPIHLAHPRSSSSHLELVDALTAFARGSLLGFGGATLLRGPAVVVRVLAALLVPWTLLLARAPLAWFPWPWVKAAWIGFDALLVVALFVLTARWRHWLGALVAGAITVDAVVTLVEVLAFNARHPGGLGLPLALLSLAGPTLAAIVSWGAVGHRRDRSLPAPRAQ